MATTDPEVLKNTQRALFKAFPKTEEGFARFLHAQLYFKYMPLYVYYMKNSFNAMLPEPDDLVKPTGGDYDVVDELVKAGVNRTNAGVASMATNSYHAKVLRFEDAEQVLSLNEDLDLGTLPKTIMPYELCRDILFQNPDRICVVDCACRNARGDKGCYPRDVCILIGEPWVSWALARDDRMNAHQVTQAEALEILKACHERGNVHAGFFKDVANGRMYAICNCCPCCCTALQSQNYLTAPQFAGSGYVAKIDRDKCKGCGLCEKKCNFMAIYRDKDNVLQVNEELCRGCEGCVTACKSDAIHLELVDASVLAPLDIKTIKASQANA